MLLASLTVGCTKDDANDNGNGNAQANSKRISIFAEGFNNNSKVLINPNNLAAGAQFVQTETIKIFDTEYPIYFDGTDYYIQSNTEFTGNLTAFYPGNMVSGFTVVLNELPIEIIPDGTNVFESIAFPMYATGTVSSTQGLVFKHLSAGMRLTLNNASSNDALMSKLTIIAQSNEDAHDLGFYGPDNQSTADDTVARWAVQGPQVPGGAVGSHTTDVNAKYASVMNFDFGNSGAIDAGSSITFCVPLTISHVDKLVIVGYNASGDEIFSVTTDGSTFPGIDAERNHMYTIPTITIN